MQKRPMNGIVLCLTVVMLFCLAMPLLAQSQDQDPPSRVARLSYLRGTVSLQPSGAQDWSQASLNYPVTTGDRVYTDQGSQAELEVGSAAVRLSETTDLTMANINSQLMQLGLGQGTVRVRVFELPPEDSIEIDTPNGALTLLRAGDYRVDTFPDDGATLVVVNGGSLEVSGGGASQTVQSGQAVKLTGTGPIQISPVEPPGPDAFDQWCRDRDRRYASSQSSRYVSRTTPGYYDLDEYGRWREDREYGPVWYPTAVPAGWVPYRYGHWVWVDPWGWTWVEDEPWGFCPFHYGRWVQAGGGWGWVPGPVVVRPYYAPALVAFVGGRNFSISIGIGSGVGWFPLGPREPYYPWYHHDDVYLRQVNVTNIRNVTNITNITNVNNVNNITYVNRTVATTVVNTETFRSAKPVYRQMVHVNAQQISRVQVIPHPEVSPANIAVRGGRPAVNPPRVAPRPVMVPASSRGGRPGMGNQPAVITRNAPPSENRPGARPSGPPVFNRPATPPPGQANRGPQQTPPSVVNRPAPAERGPGGGPPRNPPVIFTRRTPPPQEPPPAARERAMENHPGRPLEPQQVQNLRTGKPAGPMRDREVPAHPAQAQRGGRSERQADRQTDKPSRREGPKEDKGQRR